MALVQTAALALFNEGLLYDICCCLTLQHVMSGMVHMNRVLTTGVDMTASWDTFGITNVYK